MKSSLVILIGMVDCKRAKVVKKNYWNPHLHTLKVLKSHVGTEILVAFNPVDLQG